MELSLGGGCGSGVCLRAAEPFVETDAAEARFAQRHERLLLDENPGSWSKPAARQTVFRS